MLALFQTIDLALNLYTWILIGSAIFSWLYAFNVINSSNQFVNAIGTFLFVPFFFVFGFGAAVGPAF